MRTIIPKDAKLIPQEAKQVFKGVLFDVYQWPQEMYDGSTATFEMLKREDTVSVLAIKDGKLVVLEQEQPQMGFFYDVPCGRHDNEAETELQAAQRETLEETGMTFKTWRLLAVEQPHSKMDWFIYTFLATDFINQQPQQLDSGEKIKVTLRSLQEVSLLWDDPRARYLGNKFLRDAKSLDDLLELPEYKV